MGVATRLYSRPLVWGLLKGHHGDLLETTQHPPSLLAQLMAQGSLDVALLSPLQALELDDVLLLPDLCAAADGPSETIYLVSPQPFEDVRSVAVGAENDAAAALLRIVYQEKFGFQPQLHLQRPDLDRMLLSFDAALLTGDAALRQPTSAGQCLDLTAAWREITGLPWVFAVWVAQARVGLPDLPFYFKSSLRYGLSVMDSLVRESAAELDLSADRVREYLAEGQLGWVLRQREQQSLEELYRRIVPLGFRDRGSALSFGK